jgi:hypothetical protein
MSVVAGPLYPHPVMAAIGWPLFIAASVVVVVGYYAFKIRWWLEARRKRREEADRPPFD